MIDLPPADSPGSGSVRLTTGSGLRKARNLKGDNMKGHSNVYADRTEPYPSKPVVAMVPISGGCDVYTVRPLPTLAINREDWETIGRKMGWTLKKATQGPHI